MIYLLFGQPGSGKTVLGSMLAAHLSTGFHIDGDEFRALFSNNNYDRGGREENIKNANAVATYLNHTQDQDVILTLVNPYEHLRDELKQINPGHVVEILLTSTRELKREFHVEDFEIGNPTISLNTDSREEDTFDTLITCMEKKGYINQ